MLTVLGSAATLLLAFGNPKTPTASAAERLILKVGPFAQSIQVDDLERFALTGEISLELKPYSFFLTPEVRRILQQRLNVDPLIAEQFLNDLLNAVDGERLLQQVAQTFPGSSPQQIKMAFKLLLQQTSELGVLGFLRAYPTETLSVDLSAAASLAVQLNASYLQSQLLSPRLEEALKVPDAVPLTVGLDPTVPGNEIVYLQTLTLRDRSRSRAITVDIHYSQNSQGPLVVMSHGFAADRKFLRYLARHLASYGLTVVSIEHPGSDINALVQTAVGKKLSEILPPSEFIDRPQDVSFVLNKLTQFNQSDPYLKGKLNTEQVSMIGHSFGGYTALVLAGAKLDLKALRQFCEASYPLGRSPADWLQCAAAELPYSVRQFRDRRIQQVIAFNPIIGQLFGSDLSGVEVPITILSSTDDGITPTIAHQLQPFKQLPGEKYLVVAVGATHMSVTDISNLDSAVGQSTLVREVMGREAEPMRQLARGYSLAFIKQLTPDAEQYRPFLTSEYVQSLSSEQMRFRLATDLPLSVEGWLNVLALSTQKITLRPLPPSQSPVIAQIQQSFNSARQMLLQPKYCTRQLDDLFTRLLDTYHTELDEWS